MTKDNLQFNKLGEKLTAKDHKHRFTIEEANYIWFIEKGYVDLHATKTTETSHGNPLKYIMTRKEGDFIFSFPHAQYQVIATASAHTVLRKISIDELQKCFQSKDVLCDILIPQIHSWIQQLYHITPILTRVEVNMHILTHKKHTIKQNTIFSLEHFSCHHAEDRIQWIKNIKGHSKVLLEFPLTLSEGNIPFPISIDNKIQANTTTVVQTISTKSLISNNQWAHALNAFHYFVLKFLNIKINTQEERQKKKILLEKLSEEELLDDTFNQLGNVLHEESLAVVLSTNTFLRTFQIIGHTIGVKFSPPDNPESSPSIASYVNQICEASNIRYRQINFEGKWWKRDNGTILAFYGKQFQPVALVRGKKSYYEIIEPTSMKRQRVDDSIALNIAPFGYIFFEPIPEDISGGIDIIKFTLKNLFPELKKIFFLTLGGILFALFIPFANATIFNIVIPYLQRTLLFQIMLGFLVATIAASIFEFTKAFTILRLQTITNMKLQGGVWVKLLNLPAAFFRKFTIGDLFQRVFSISQVRAIITRTVLSNIISMLFSIIYFIVMLYYSWELALAGLVIVLIGGIVTAICIFFKIKIDNTILHHKSKLDGFIFQVISSIEKFRTTASEKIAFSFWGKRYAAIKRKELQSRNIQNIVIVCSTMLPSFALFTIFTTATYLTAHLHKALSIGDFIAFSVAYGVFSASFISIITTSISSFGIIIPHWKLSNVIFTTPPEIHDKKLHPGTLQGSIRIENIFFKYQDNGPLILKDISIKVYPGEFIGIVGPSGSGKSTLIRLLLGFENPGKGSIFYDDKDLSDLDLRKIRRQLGVVTQDGEILSGTIYENITCGGIYTAHQIQQAAELSGLIEDLNSLPMGLHTYLFEGGKTLSGGQKQRLLITRALLGSPRILLFDEATSALDNKAQEMLSNNIEQLDVSRIVIAHRMSTIHKADRIYVIDKGTIIDSGTFEELASRKGLFSNMVKRQQS